MSTAHPSTTMPDLPDRSTRLAFFSMFPILIGCLCGLTGLVLVLAGNTANASTAAGNQEANDGQPSESAPENWEIAATLAGHKDVVKSLAFSPDGKRLFSGSFEGEIKVWDTHTRKELASIAAHKHGNWCTALAVSQSGDVLASGAGPIPGEVKLWDARALQLRATSSRSNGSP